MEKMKFGSPFHDHVVAGWPGTSNVIATGGVGKDGLPFAAWDQGVPNGIGMGARWDSDGIDVGGFIWCAIGEFLDSEAIEHSFPLLPVFRSVFWKDAVGYGKYRGGRSMNSMYQIHGVPSVYVVSQGGFSGRPVAPGLFGGYPSRPVASAYVRNHNLSELAHSGRTPASLEEAVERVTGDWQINHQNSGADMLVEGDLFATCAPSGPGYGDVLERDPDLVMKDLREQAISHRTARDIFHVVYREDNLVVDNEATALARKEERERRLARAVPYSQWEPAWLDRRPPQRVTQMYGEWPHGMSTPLTDWEPIAELLDEHVREGGAPRAKPRRY
jgi:acetophenone carboxylase